MAQLALMRVQPADFLLDYELRDNTACVMNTLSTQPYKKRRSIPALRYRLFRLVHIARRGLGWIGRNNKQSNIAWDGFGSGWLLLGMAPAWHGSCLRLGGTANGASR